MTIFFQDQETEDVIYQTNPEDSPIVPNIGETVRIWDKWYEVVERTFYYVHLIRSEDNSCTIWIKELKDNE